MGKAPGKMLVHDESTSDSDEGDDESLLGVEPVTDVSNTGDGALLGGWVAEVAIIRPVSKLVRSYHRVQQLQVRCGCGLGYRTVNVLLTLMH